MNYITIFSYKKNMSNYKITLSINSGLNKDV